MCRAGRGVERDKELAIKWYKKAILQKNGRAMFNLATAYYNGDGVTIDDTKAFAWFTLALENGSKDADEAVKRMKSESSPWRVADAFKYIAGIYQNGVELPKDLKEAAQWYRRAAARGDREAQISLAGILLTGRGVPQDFAEARKWCEAAAKQNDSNGEYCMGLIQEKGLGISSKPREAFKWYRLAASWGHPRAMQALGNMYASGIGTKRDRAQAYVLFIRSAVTGDEQASQDAARLRPEMDKREIQTAIKKLRAMRIDPVKLDALLKESDTPQGH
jgi:TPR repeat protein